MKEKTASLVIIFLILMTSLSYGQSFPSGIVIQDGSQRSTTPYQILEVSYEKVLLFSTGYLSGAPFKLDLLDNYGRRISTYYDDSIVLENVSIQNNKILVLTQKFSNFPSGERSLLVFDTLLNIISNFQVIKQNWPRNNFANRSWEPQILNGKVAYFGMFFNHQPNEANRIFGWLMLNETYDTLSAYPYTVPTDSFSIYSLYQGSNGAFYGNGLRENVSRPWSTTISVNIILSFDSAFNLLVKGNTFVPSSISGYPRVLRSADMLNIISNEHSYYAMVNYESASSTSFSDKISSFTVLQFDTNLIAKKAIHSIEPPNKVAEVRGRGKNLTFDVSGNYIYAVGSKCDPLALNFNEQSRECTYTIFKYDTALNLIWKKEIFIQKTFLGYETMSHSKDGGLIIAGMRIDSLPNPNIRNIFIVKLDSAGRHSVSVADLPQTAKVKLYPNPVDDLMLIQWDQGAFHQIDIYNLQGQKCGSWKTDPQTNLMELQLGYLPAGLYHYRLLGNGQLQTGKFVKK
ncbi:MAG: T9SS type A sorting domain-containing protein [Sphingobacteriaceae bacterium]|nr:T9SS type A sorting domain-containing protein [Sphingobacteriaceae bacterium]